jgi:hypothetical protein
MRVVHEVDIVLEVLHPLRHRNRNRIGDRSHTDVLTIRPIRQPLSAEDNIDELAEKCRQFGAELDELERLCPVPNGRPSRSPRPPRADAAAIASLLRRISYIRAREVQFLKQERERPHPEEDTQMAEAVNFAQNPPKSTILLKIPTSQNRTIVDNCPLSPDHREMRFLKEGLPPPRKS